MVGMTILHQAAMSQHDEAAGEIVNLLLAHGANPRAVCSAQNWSALHIAVTSDCRSAVTALMNHDRSLHLLELMAGLRPFQRCSSPPLMLSHRLQSVSLLSSPLPNFTSPLALHRCAVAGQPETMQWLIETYPDILLPELPKLSNAGMSFAMAAVFEENSAEMLEVTLATWQRAT